MSREAIVEIVQAAIKGTCFGDDTYMASLVAADRIMSELAKPAAVPGGWRTFPDEVPPPDTECLVGVKFRGVTFRAVDVWEMQSESPVPWSSATVGTGYGWSNYCDDQYLRWIPIAHLTAPQPPAPVVDVEAVRGTIFRMKDNHKLRESRCKPDPLISIWANELARAIGENHG